MVTLPDNLTMQGEPVDITPRSFGQLQDSSPLLGNPAALRSRIDAEGYLFLRRYLDRHAVMDARLEVCCRLATRGLIDPGHPPIEAIALASNPPATYTRSH